LVHMLDAVTTNKTDFFREPTHFDYLTRTVLPRLQQVHGSGGRLSLQAWSAGCSTGEEPYTLAMVLNEFALQQSGFSFSVSATDLSTRVLEKAISGVYDEEKIAPVPMPLRRKYLLRSKDRTRQTVRIVQELRSKISFGRLNFMDRNFTMKKMHFIFCRNVIIYFDRA
ncbi:MAG: chemotaxis protein CheR, partial [Deltaproteobacteria bacterium]|nr:chemotaxis protein CheR [Deltaproteobacteria bacterium]